MYAPTSFCTSLLTHQQFRDQAAIGLANTLCGGCRRPGSGNTEHADAGGCLPELVECATCLMRQARPFYGDLVPVLQELEVVPVLVWLEKRLNTTELDLLVGGYQAGATVYELAEQFHIHRNTISRHLKAQGVQLRNSSLSEAEQARAVDLMLAHPERESC